MMNPSQDRSYIGWWPTVTGDDWCGEFKPVAPKLDLDAISDRMVPRCYTCGMPVNNHTPDCHEQMRPFPR